MSRDDLTKVLLGVVSARFGPGAIGRIGTITKAALVVLTLMAITFAFKNIYCATAIALSAAVLAAYSIERAFRYAEKHPEIAAMDGAQISKILTQQSAMKPLPGLEAPSEGPVTTTQNPLIDIQTKVSE